MLFRSDMFPSHDTPLLLSPRLTAGQQTLILLIEVRILGGQRKKKEKMLGSGKISLYLCNQIEGSSLTSWKICSRGATVSARCLYHRGYRFESCREYTFRNKTTDSVPYTMRNGVMSVRERTLVYRENTRASQPDLLRTNDYS